VAKVKPVSGHEHKAIVKQWARVVDGWYRLSYYVLGQGVDLLAAGPLADG
jgi:hypothetical protein